MVESNQIKIKIKNQIRKTVFLFDILLACVYSVALMLQRTAIYRKIGSDRLKLTAKMVVRLVDFFDPKVYYLFYEKLFYEKFLPANLTDSTELVRESGIALDSRRPNGADLFNELWKSLHLKKELGSADYTLAYSILDRPPKRIFLFNTPKQICEVVDIFQRMDPFKSSIQIVNLNIFNLHDSITSYKIENAPFHEIQNELIASFDSDDMFIFSICDPVPPLGHVKNIFLNVFPKIPEGMRVCVYGVTRDYQHDEWIEWNVSFWSSETLLEILLSNSENLVIDWDSRNLDFSREVHWNAINRDINISIGNDLLILRRSKHELD